MKKLILLYVFIAISVCSTFAKIAMVKGKVTDKKGTSVEFVNVVLVGTRLGTTTNSKGEYVLSNVPLGRQEILFTSIGFSPLKKVVVVQEENVILNVELEEKLVGLDEVTVKGKAHKKYTADRVSSSLRMLTPLLEMPQNIGVVTNSALENQQALSMIDGVLRNVSGATRLEHWGELYARVNMRGDRIAAFMDGVNITSSWGPLNEDASYVERIEIVKGPAGFMMSNGNPNGIYNIVTKKPTGKAFNGYVRTTLGSFDLYRVESDVDACVSDKLSFRLNLMGQNKKSFRKYEFNDRYIIAPSIRYKVDGKTEITANYIYQKVKMSELGSAYVFSSHGYKSKPVEYTMTDPGIDPGKINDHTFSVNLQHRFNADWKLTSQISYLYNYQLNSSIWVQKGKKKFPVRVQSLWEGLNKQRFGQIFLNGRFNTGVITHKILLGVDAGTKNYLADWGQSHELDAVPFDFDKDVVPVPPSNGYAKFDVTSKSLEQRATLGGKIDQKYASVYFQDEIGFFENRLRLTLAGRYTDVSQSSYGQEEKSAERLTPRLGLSGSINEDLSVYTLYDQSFIPQAGLLRNGGKIKPITGDNYEIGVKGDWFDKRWNTVLSVYQIIKNNELVKDPKNGPSDHYVIVKGQSRARGLELDVKGNIFKGLDIILNYALTENVVTESNVPTLKVDDRIAGYAKHTGNAWLSYVFQREILKGLGFSLGTTFLGDRSSWKWANTEIHKEMDDYFKMDVGVSWENQKVKIIANVFNVLDEYLYSGSPYQNFYYYQAEAPRNWRLSVNYKF